MNSFRHLNRHTDSLDKCSACGLCISVCPAWQAEKDASVSPKSFIALIRGWMAGKISDSNIQPILEKCLLCGRCIETCPVHLPLPAIFRAAFADLPARETCAAKFLAKPLLGKPALLQFLLKLSSNLGKLGANIGLRKNAKQNPEISCFTPKDEEGGIIVFAGCQSLYTEPQIAQECHKIFERLDLPWKLPNFACCGASEIARGRSGDAAVMIRHNLKISHMWKADKIVALCPHCLDQIWNVWPHLPWLDDEERKRAQDFAEKTEGIASFLATRKGQMKEVETQGLLHWHSPCHIDKQEEQIAISLLLDAGIRMSSRSKSCCGNICKENAHPLFNRFPGRVQKKEQLIKNCETGRKGLARSILQNSLAVSAQTVVTGCPGCLTRLKNAGGQLPVQTRHWLELYSENMAKKP